MSAAELATNHRVKLAGRTYLFQKGDIHFHPGGTLNWGQLLEEELVELNGMHYVFKAGYWLHFYENGMVESGFIEGDVILTNEGVEYVMSGLIEFHSNGALKSGELNSDVSFTNNGVMYTFRGSHLIGFHANGHVESGIIKDDVLITKRGSGIFVHGQ